MQYVPWVAQINLENMDFPVIAYSFGPVLPPWLPAVYGIYNTDQIPFIHPGAAGSICITANNSYWATWGEGFQMEPPPSRVHAAWGNTAL
jgi:hypothetical protein